MDRNEIFALINQNQACHLATSENNVPHVRGVLVYRADENGIIFHTGKFKDLYNQLIANPRVEFCFTNHDMQNLIQIRISGKVELVEDMALKKEIVEKRDFLKPWVKEQGYEGLAVFCLKNGKATVWTMATNFSPKTFIHLR
jgi:pyridoxamine 5'-phosphate oxidase